MARNGYRFFDTDAHVGPYVDVLDPYLSGEDKARLAGWTDFQTTSKNGHISYNKGQRKYQRRLYSEVAEPTQGGYMAGFTGVKRERAISPDVSETVFRIVQMLGHPLADVKLEALCAKGPMT